MFSNKQLGFLACAAAQILLPAALLVPTSRLAHIELAAIFLPPIIICEAYAWSCGLGAIVAVHTLWACELLFFRNPRSDFRLVHRRSKEFRALSKEKEKNGGEAVWKESHPEEFGKRVWWVLKLISSLRFVGWDTGDGRSARVQSGTMATESRGFWLLRRAVGALVCFLIIDSTTSYQLFDPYFLGHADIDAPLPSFLPRIMPRAIAGFTPRLVRMAIFGIQQFSIFSITFDIPAMIWVSLGGLGLVDDWWGGIQNWPSVMGNPLVIFESGLRGFWGKFWHQLFRPMFVDPGKHLAQVFGVPLKSASGYIIQVLTAFSLSGALHAATLPRNLPELNFIRYAVFFWIHGLCVIVELFTERALGNLIPETSGPSSRRIARKALRAAWAFGVMYCTVPVIGSELVKVMVAVDLRPVALFPTPVKAE